MMATNGKIKEKMRKKMRKKNSKNHKFIKLQNHFQHNQIVRIQKFCFSVSFSNRMCISRLMDFHLKNKKFTENVEE